MNTPIQEPIGWQTFPPTLAPEETRKGWTLTEVRADVAQILTAHCGALVQANSTANLCRELDVESLDVIELELDWEEHFDVYIDPDQADEIATVADLVAVIWNDLGRQARVSA